MCKGAGPEFLGAGVQRPYKEQGYNLEKILYLAAAQSWAVLADAGWRRDGLPGGSHTRWLRPGSTPGLDGGLVLAGDCGQGR